MKNKKIMLLLLVALVGCSNNVTSSKGASSVPTSNNTSSETTTSSSIKNSSSASSLASTSSSTVPEEKFVFGEVLEELALGVKVKVEGTEKYDGNTTKLFLQNAAKNKEFSFMRFNDENREVAALHEYYVSKEDKDYIYATRLNANNEYNYYEVYNPSTSERYTWNDGYNNPFLTLSVDHFEKVDEMTYSLNVENLETMSPALTTLLYGNPGLNLTAFTMYVEEGKLWLEAFANFAGSTTYEYFFKAEVLATGENVEMDYRSKPFAEVEDANFTEMMNALKANNYTATIVNYDDGFEDEVSVYYSNPDKVYYETFGYQSGFYVTEDGLVQEVKKVEDNFYKTGAPMEGDIAEVMPSFKLSRAVFDEVDGVYTLKEGVEGELTAITVLETYADSLNEFTITKSADGYEFRNVLGDYETVITFTDIGTTNVGYTEDTVLEPVASSTWADVLDEADYQLIVNLAGEDVAAMIPVPDNYDTWIQLSEEAGVVMLVAEASETLDDDFFGYYLKLEEAGIFVSEEEGMNGGMMGLIPVMVDDVEQILVVEFLEYEGMFCIAIYFGE